MITHPEKILFPADGISKGELASYYEWIAPVMLPHLRRRPITMERFHRGIGAPGFFQKDVSKGFPEWLERVEFRSTAARFITQLQTTLDPCFGLPTRTASRFMCGRRACRTCTTPISASSILIRQMKMHSKSCAGP